MNRYAAQIALPDIGEDGQQQLARSRIVIIGVGGLGCPAAQYLALAGVGEITLLDFDVVDPRNLNRQTLFTSADVGKDKVDVAARCLAASNPAVTIRTIRDRFVHTMDHQPFASLVSKQDLLVDASDNYATRRAVNLACLQSGLPWVMGSAIRYEGQLVCFRPDRPCYECLYGEMTELFEDCTGGGISGPTAGTIGSMMANMVLQQILSPATVFRGLLAVDMRRMEFRRLKTTYSDSCPVCSQRASA